MGLGYRLNRLDELVFMAGPKPMRTEFGIHQRLKSCGGTVEWWYATQIRSIRHSLIDMSSPTHLLL